MWLKSEAHLPLGLKMFGPWSMAPFTGGPHRNPLALGQGPPAAGAPRPPPARQRPAHRAHVGPFPGRQDRREPGTSALEPRLVLGRRARQRPRRRSSPWGAKAARQGSASYIDSVCSAAGLTFPPSEEGAGRRPPFILTERGLARPPLGPKRTSPGPVPSVRSKGASQGLPLPWAKSF